ncbi:phosphate/phosphite/phosphonate ABC transporter substrate-binding protein [Dendrosporobacter sp. 1207_IL3150]|uniref:phosphate/phosphite/phosphonate ABC transporter substrate-binding protein n=1 Tax=Dendrosporobacter sp. 1207_IL3150 TaxID=3084054 RepID=UPI002FDB7CFA
MKKRLLALALLAIVGLTSLTGCGSSKNAGVTAESKDIVMVWLPNESSEGHKGAREEIGKIIEKATGKKVEHKLTTDYAITVETLANNKAALAYLGPQGYVEAHNKNAAVLPLVVSSGPSGTINDAVYYSWLTVNKGAEDEYKSNNTYAIDKIEGKTMSFVSNSSTSGFKVPSSGIVKKFSAADKWKNIKAADLMEGGKDKFFKEVMFGGSHQGAAVNLLTGKVQVAAFCDEVLRPYIKLTSGEENKVGAVYAIKEGAGEPFQKLIGKEYVVISSTPVLNSPLVMNTKMLSKEDQEKILAALTSPEINNNPKVFVPKGQNFTGMFSKTKNEQFVKIDDAWFQPIRDLTK